MNTLILDHFITFAESQNPTLDLEQMKKEFLTEYFLHARNVAAIEEEYFDGR